MKINRVAFELALAKNRLTISDIITSANCSSVTVQKAKQGKEIRPAIVGKLCVALGVPVEDIIEQEA